MHNNMEERASWEDLVKTARLRALRVERLDTLVAAVVLVLLLLGWAVSYAPVDRWPGGHLLTAGRSPHA
jgi:hypothetical protein